MPDDTERTDSRAGRRGPQAVQSEAWKRTLEERDAIAEDRRDDGWSVLAVTAAQTDPVSRDMREDDTFGLVHVIPNNDADELAETFDSDEFTEYLAYGRNVGGYMFLVTEFIDPEAKRSILVAGRYSLVRAEGMINSARAEDVLYTYFKTIDGTILGSFEHEEYEPLVGRPDA